MTMPPSTIPPSAIEGVDASSGSGHLDYAGMAEKLQFVYHKATDGVGTTDPMLYARAANIRAVGMGSVFGVYHFARVRHGMAQDADEQCKEFLDAKAKAQAPLPPWFDVELTSLTPQAQKIVNPPKGAIVSPDDVDIVHDEVRAAVELFWETWDKVATSSPPPVLPFYSSPGEIQMLGLDKIPGIQVYPLVIAAYNGGRPPPIPQPWTSCAFHQYAGDVNEFGGIVDQVRFFGTIDQLKAMGQ
jgi:GH25 family lysozyme M1 (1,4-beta-N-acetylmuramidase)